MVIDMSLHSQPEKHKALNIGWLRAAVLGANDGIVSTASLIVGVASANVSYQSILVSGIAGLTAGALSMAAGEYVSVSSQADTEESDLAREKLELDTDPEFELQELQQIYIGRGLSPDLAKQVAIQLTKHDALGSHARDELGITEIHKARPIQAALTSAITFAVGAALPLLVVVISPLSKVTLTVSSASLFFLVLLGILSAIAGGANLAKAALRVGLWGAIAMAITSGIGHLFGTVV